MVVCGRCGARMAARSEGQSGDRGRQYACDRAVRHGCGSNSCKSEAVEEIVVGFVLDALSGTNLAQARARRTVDSSASLVASIGADEQMLADLSADHASRRIGRGEWLAAKDIIDARLTESRRALEVVAADSDLDDAVFDGLDRDGWEELELEQKRAVIRVFVDRVVVDKGRPGRTFDKSRVHVVPA